jgi:hypothetical protein
MENYFARIELHGTRTKEDYEHLYNQLKVVGFYAMLVDPKGVGMTLPSGSYASYGAYSTVQEAHNAVRRAITATGFGGNVIVVEFSAWEGSNV